MPASVAHTISPVLVRVSDSVSWRSSPAARARHEARLDHVLDVVRRDALGVLGAPEVADGVRRDRRNRPQAAEVERHVLDDRTGQQPLHLAEGIGPGHRQHQGDAGNTAEG